MADPNPPQWDPHRQQWYRNRWDPSRRVWEYDYISRPDSGSYSTAASSTAPYNPAHAYSNASYTQNSHSQHVHPQASSSAPVRQGSTGPMVVGSYTTQNTAQSEQLDPAFCVRSGDYFQPGRLFAILFSEAAGANAVNGALNGVTYYNKALSLVQYNEFVHTQVRRFIVVKRRREFCYAVPIFTYNKKGTKKHGVVPSEHSIAYSYGNSPQLVSGEQELIKDPICIIMNDQGSLDPASRIYYGIQHPIQYNVKVKDFGYVHPDQMVKFLGYWNEEQGNETQQAAEVTAGTDGDDAVSGAESSRSANTPQQ